MVNGGGTSDYSTLLVHVFFSSKKDEVLLLAKDPVMGKVYKMQVWLL